MPDISAHVGETRQTINLAAFGFGNFGAAFHPADRRTVQRVRRARQRHDAGARLPRAERKSRRASQRRSGEVLLQERARTRSSSWLPTRILRALAASASRAQSAHAQVQTAQALFTQANDMKASGLVAGIDVLRADVQLSTERQRATAADNDYEKEKLSLAHLIGLPIGQTFTLVDTLPDVPIPEMTLQSRARSGVPRPAGLSGGARAAARRRIGARGGHGRESAGDQSQRGLRRSRPDDPQLARHVTR